MKIINKIVLLIKNIIILFFLFFSVNVHAKNKWMLKDIYITPLNNISRIEVLNYITEFYKRDVIFSKDIYDISHILLATKKFKDIKIISYNNALIIKCLERPIIRKINYIGNKLITNNIFFHILQNINIKKGNIFHSNILNVVIKDIKKYCLNINKKNIKIKIIVIFSHHNLISLKIICSELKNCNIKKINIIGNHSFSKKSILSLFASKHSLHFLKSKKQSIYYVKKLAMYIKKLKHFYINHGYIYFSINRIDVIKDINKHQVIINIDYKEGKKYIITNIFLHENTLLHFKEINNFIKSLIYQPYCITNILNMKNNIKNMFLINGYINAKISIYYKINTSNTGIIFYFYINSGKPYVLHKIYFRNKKYINDKILNHAIQNLEGHYLNIKLLNEVKKNLMQQGYYKNIELTLYPMTHYSNKINAVYTLTYKDTGNINFSLGYGLHNGISFNFNLIQNDLLGSGINVKLNSIKNDYELSNNITFINPYFNSFSDFLQGKLFYNIFKPNLVEHNIYKNKNYGFESKMGFIFNTSNKFNIGIGFIHNDFSNQQSKISIWNYSTVLDQYLKNTNIKNATTNDINCNFLWSYDSLNSHYFPTSGNYTTINVKSTLPGFNNFFYLIELDSLEYFPLKITDHLILLIHSNLGLRSNITLNQFYKDEGFYAGGMGTIRGFKNNSISPKFIYYNPLKNFCVGKQNYKFCASDDYSAGNTMMITNIELITPIFFNKDKSLNIRSSIFFDAASIWNVQWTRSLDAKLANLFDYNNPNKVRISTGISLQWQSPLGPLQCSYSYPIQFFSEDTIEQFQFNIGKSW